MMLCMRTTLDIDSSVLEAARSIALLSRRSIGTVISELAARGMKAGQTTSSESGHPVFLLPGDAQPLNLLTIRGLIDDDGLPD